MSDTIFEAIGDNGIDAIDGESFSQYPPQMGENGSKGRDATPAGRGFKGGNIMIKLSSIPNQREPGHIYVEGEITYENRPSVKIGSEFILGTTGLINFVSRGGNGGNGAKGGDGQYGGDGFPGVDATEYSEPSDGGPGGNGGDGGRGSDGGDGGNGGDVKVLTSEQDAHLLMLLGKCDLTGGHGGLPGSHGKGGKGGKGALGGKGNELFLQGNDGIDGKDGKTLDINLYRGHEGRNGKLEYGIINFNNFFEPRIDHTFRLEISEFMYEAQGDSGIIEPGSTIQIINMKFRNIGMSPTPKYTPIRIELDSFNNEWINNITHLYAPYDILPNDVKYLDNSQRIIISINELNTINDGSPLYQQVILRGFRAIMSQIERPIEILNVNDQLNLLIQQPINISEVIAIRSPDNLYYEVFWFVTNISKIPFGRNSSCRRMIMTKLTKGESYGIEIDSQEIQLLNGGVTLQVTSRVKLDSYETHQFTVTLQIGSNNYHPTVLKPIQTRSFIINPIPSEDKHLLLNVTKNECININHHSDYQDLTGSIYLQLSNANVNTTNIGKVHINGNIKFTNGHIVLLDHYYNFDIDNYITITQKDPQKMCEVTIVTTEQDSYLFALLNNTYDDTTNIIEWKFQTINQTYNRVNTYSTIFKPRVDYYIPIIENDMQIFEPNSKGVIQGLRIRNDGEMPTPDNHNIIIKLLPTENIIPNDEIFFIISKSIAYNSTYELENSTFKFSIKNNEWGFENKIPLQLSDCFKFKAVVTSIEHVLPDFNNFENQRITIQYPIQIGEYLSFRHPSEDEEKYSVFWKIKNISNIEFGKNSEVGRLIETSLHDDNTNDIIYTTEVDSLTGNNYLLLNTNVVINEKTQFHSNLRLGSTNSPGKLSPIQSYSFHLLPLSSDDGYKNLDLVFDLNVGRLTLDGIQPNDSIQPGSFQLLLSTPETNKVGDVTIKGTLQYTNGWIIQINDTFSLDLTGLIHLYPSGKNYPSGKIDIEIAKEDTHLLYLIEKSILQTCEDQLYRVIDNTETPATTKDYNKIYEFTLIDFDCVPEDDSEIYEPGSRIIIRNIKVKNTGGMPTPISHDVEVNVDLSKSTLISLPNNNKLKLPKPIEHSKQVELNSIKEEDEHCLEFQINQQDSASKDKPLNLFDTINLKATMFGINREITSFTFPKQLNIQYPIQICPNTKIRDFPYKDLTRISWKINNISKINFGSESDSKRIIKVQVKINDMTPSNSLKFKTGQTLTTFEEEITVLNANQSREMYCELVRTLSSEDPTIIEVNFSITLCLGSIENPDKGSDIEIRNKCIEVSPSYKTNKDADFLLVVSPKTKKKNVDNWKNLCQQLELTMSLWDIKREGHFDLIESGVIEDISGKSIVILNDELDEDEEEKEGIDIKQTLDYLDPFHFYQAVNNFNIKFFIAGAIIDDKRVENLFIPKEMMEISNDQPSSSMVSKIKSYVQQKGIIKHAAVMERDVVKQPVKSAKIENVQTRLRPSSFNLFRSEESYKEKKLKKLSKSLQKNYPGHRYVLVSMMGNDRSSDQVILCKTASRTKQHLLYYSFSESITDYNESNKIGLLSCVSFTKKLEKLQKLFDTNKDPEILEIYKNLIEVDLTVEVIGLTGTKETNKDITSDILLSHMELFTNFCEFIKNSKETNISANSVDWMISVFAKLKILLQYSNDSLININSASRIKQLKLILDGEYLRTFGRFSNQTNQSLTNILDIKIKFIKSDFKNEYKPAKSEKYTYFKYKLIGILKKNNLKSDFELFGDKLDFILSQNEYNNIHDTHEKTTGTIRRKKTRRQDQIKSLYIQNIFEDPSKINDVKSEDTKE
ncbi:hypothetical protein RhiirA5_429523 [Rhizophagus irregularis]|uniref:DUF7932 domain-containing protein n=4 Tax=Rhizophagus irregularis TaxID=588596 RepID=A0A2I1E7W2_9GLOM|nr:hypothetical protein RirG_034460 [Rhizophagus irregularis DAOM 197198w]PKB99541.1 hypothetical protein RhiirA5_429523 [Rhizophagus irregularis]PKY18225.1 hypothetical protein RhiirB3_431002 [Rhizophagus irregularis]UZO25658.1 hypothetical protein OCT59_017922 [Rhizophagus irregularis]GBC41476.1 LPXTG cell wall anchor domain-containing protein [Rhizophagus irregularis DAOM 181602=DAOM 197198]